MQNLEFQVLMTRARVISYYCLTHNVFKTTFIIGCPRTQHTHSPSNKASKVPTGTTVNEGGSKHATRSPARTQKYCWLAGWLLAGHQPASDHTHTHRKFVIFVLSSRINYE